MIVLLHGPPQPRVLELVELILKHWLDFGVVRRSYDHRDILVQIGQRRTIAEETRIGIAAEVPGSGPRDRRIVGDFDTHAIGGAFAEVLKLIHDELVSRCAVGVDQKLSRVIVIDKSSRPGSAGSEDAEQDEYAN